MKKDLLSSIQDIPTINPVQDRIKLLFDNDFLPHEIAALTGLRKKIIKAISKGKYIPSGEEYIKLINVFDETIARLKISDPDNLDEHCSKANLDTEGKIIYKLNVARVTLFKGTDDKQMIVTIHGDIANP